VDQLQFRNKVFQLMRKDDNNYSSLPWVSSVTSLDCGNYMIWVPTKKNS